MIAQSPRVIETGRRKQNRGRMSQSKTGSRKQHTVSRGDRVPESASRNVHHERNQTDSGHFISPRASEIARLGISEYELHAAKNWLQSVPMKLYKSRELVIEQDAGTQDSHWFTCSRAARLCDSNINA
jgi:hypothetical protein